MVPEAEQNGRVLFVVRGDDTVPSSRFRAYQYREPLAAIGVQADYLRIEPSSRALLQAKFHYQLATISKGYDAVVYLKQLEAFRIGLLRRSCRRVFFDFDDAIFLTEGDARFRRALAAAGAVIAGNETLAARAREVTPQVSIIPTVVPVAARPEPFPKSGDALQLLWVGTSDNIERYLGPVLRAFAKVRIRHPELVIRIVTERPERAPQAPGISAVLWSPEVEAAELAACHVGLMPLHDDEWSRGKCACKALQYLAAGRPVLSSPVGVNSAIFTDVDFGWLVSAENDWEAALDGVAARGSELRIRGESGHAYVQRAYSLKAWAPKLWTVLSTAPVRS